MRSGAVSSFQPRRWYVHGGNVAVYLTNGGVIVVDEIHTHATAVAADRQLVIEKGRFVSGAAVTTESVRFAALR